MVRVYAKKQNDLFLKFKKYALNCNFVSVLGIFLNSSTYCYTGVKMFSNPHLLTVVPSIPVYAISTEDRNQIVYSVSKTDLNGQACILTPCFGNIKLVVESKSERAFAAATNKQQITSMLFYNVSDYMDHIVVDIDQSLKGIGNDTGPVYIDKEECKRGRQYFLFHFQGLSGKLMTNPYAEEHDYRTSWNPTFPRKSCFVKVQIQVYFLSFLDHIIPNRLLSLYAKNDILLLLIMSLTLLIQKLFQTKSKSLGIIANSYDESGYWFGTFVAPLHGNHNGKRAACIEFRCPVYDSLNEEIPTILNADMPGSSNCTLMYVRRRLCEGSRGHSIRKVKMVKLPFLDKTYNRLYIIKNRICVNALFGADSQQHITEIVHLSYEKA